MADLDTRSKRASSVAIMCASVLAPPDPDGTLDAGDRAHVAFSYSGIAATVTADPDFAGATAYRAQLRRVYEARLRGVHPARLRRVYR